MSRGIKEETTWHTEPVRCVREGNKWTNTRKLNKEHLQGIHETTSRVKVTNSWIGTNIMAIQWFVCVFTNNLYFIKHHTCHFIVFTISIKQTEI
jgi:hypothetical protein